ncbi:MAG: competence/damage-inducible protein A [Rubricoccaceae bacterium]|nr:competence/damage-inducible protein A [Rubricoccaceae bacterium]
MKGTILTVGDEILIGQIVNSNASWLGEQLRLVGVDVVRMDTVGDRVEDIGSAIEQGFERGDFVVVTGGLGPTHDDVTREAMAAVCGVPLERRADVLRDIERKFVDRKRSMPDSNRKLADVPRGFDILQNPSGMAPGLWGGRGNKQVVVLPGVPHEMKAIMKQHVLPRLAQQSDAVVLHRTLLTAGQGESALAELLGELSDVLSNGVSLAYLPGSGVVRLRVTSKGEDRSSVEAGLQMALQRIYGILGDRILGEDDQTLEGVVGGMLRERGLSIATAESCTGGAVASAITSIPGSSDYFLGGVVAYDNSVKVAQLGVDGRDLDRYGAVSEAVALQMASGVRRAFGADLGISTTGIAGPDGGTPEKPVGTVWLGFDSADGNHATRLQLTGDRLINIQLSTTGALNFVRRQLLRADQ